MAMTIRLVNQSISGMTIRFLLQLPVETMN